MPPCGLRTLLPPTGAVPEDTVHTPGAISVIVSTYNNPRALHLVLVGLARQRLFPEEVVIADDGSGPETRSVIEHWGRDAPFPVRHVRHADQGVRKTAILNRAVETSRGRYLIFLDGDCVPSARMVQVHAHYARWNRFIGGGSIRLNPALSERLTEERILAGDLDRPHRWWLATPKRFRLLAGTLPLVNAALDRWDARNHGWPGENASTYREHVYRINGFDERFTWGYEDSDFHLRLECAGFRAYSVRYRTPVFHLHHERPYVDPVQTERNRRLRDASHAAGVAFTPYGISRAATPASPDGP